MYQLKFLNFQKWDAKKYSKMYHMTFMHINHKYYIKRLFNCHICHHFGVTLKLDMGVKDLPPCFPACWWEPHGPVDRTPSFSGNLEGPGGDTVKAWEPLTVGDSGFPFGSWICLQSLSLQLLSRLRPYVCVHLDTGFLFSKETFCKYITLLSNILAVRILYRWKYC